MGLMPVIKRKNMKRRIAADVFLLSVSVVIAIFIIKSGIIHSLIDSFKGLHYLGAFFAGTLFTSFFTVAPSAAILIELAQENSVVVVSIVGGIGAAVGDYIIFRFIRDRVAEDIKYVISHTGIKILPAVFRTRIFLSLTALTGAFFIASPLPDEIGLAMMGLSGVKTATLLPFSFVLHAAGIFVIGSLGGIILGS